MEFPQKVRLSNSEDEFDRIMREKYRFRPTSLAETSPALTALKPDHHIPVLANYKKAIAGVTIAFACITLPKPGRPMEVITLLNSQSQPPRLYRISDRELLKGVSPTAKSFPSVTPTVAVAPEPNTEPDLFSALTQGVIPKHRWHFKA